MMVSSSEVHLSVSSGLEQRTSLINFQHRQKSLLWNLHPADLLHSLLAFLLFLEQFALARDVAAVTLRDHVLAHRFHGFAGDYFCADGRLDRHFEKLTRDQFLHLRGEGSALRGGGVAMQNERQRIDRLASHQHVELDQIALPITRQVIVERSISTRS